MFIFKKKNCFNENQILIKKGYSKVVFRLNKVALTINIFGMSAFSNYLIAESFLLLETISMQRAAVNSFQQKYRTINIQLVTHLRDKNLNYFLNVLKIFYLPSYKRQNLSFFLDQILESKFMFGMSNINFIPFLPNAFFRWKLLLGNIFFFNKNNLVQILLFLNYIGFYFVDENDVYSSELFLLKKEINNKLC